jgi:hypothetical protein
MSSKKIAPSAITNSKIAPTLSFNHYFNLMIIADSNVTGQQT